MKKFWKSIVVFVLIMSGIGTYYVQSALATNELPELKIETVSGDEQLIKNLVIDGSFYQNGLQDSLNIDQHGTTYKSELSIIESFYGFNSHTLNRLQAEYSKIMRGIGNVYNNVYEDDEYLVVIKDRMDYGLQLQEPEQDTLTLKVLDKKTDKIKVMGLNVERKARVNLYSIQEVQMRDGQVVVLLKQYERVGEDGHVQPKIAEYILDVEKEKMISHKTIVPAEPINEEEGNLSIQKLHESVNYMPSDYAVFRVIVGEEYMTGENQEPPKEHLAVYNINTGEVTTLDLTVEEYGRVTDFDGENLYYETQSGESTVINVYNLNERDFVNELEIDNADAKSDVYYHNGVNALPYFALAVNGKYYVLSRFEDELPAITVYDSLTSNILYEGVIKSESEEQKDLGVNIHHMSFR